MDEVSPREVLKQVAAAVPEECHENIIIVGSLAVGYHFFGMSGNIQVRTKDIDCVLSPRIKAVESGQAVAQQLMNSGWQQRKDGDHGEPGNASTPDDSLPSVRLYPPNSKKWFIELLTVPESEDDPGKKWTRLELTQGHYGLPSFKFLSLTTFQPYKTEYGILYARPEMMALANLLEHPEIKRELMSGLIADRRIKRSNKDLGRVLAIARLSREETTQSWPDVWVKGLQSCFPRRWKELARSAGGGLRALLASDPDLEEAFHTCQNGLLSSTSTTLENLRVAGQRFIQDCIEPLERRADEGQ